MQRARILFAIPLLSMGASLLAPRADGQVGPPVTPGFANVPQVAGTLLSGLNAPEQGRTAIIAYHDGVLFTVPEMPSSQPGADWQVRTWDISDPTQPIELAQWGETPHPINAHGYFKIGPHLTAGPNWPPGQEWSFRVTPDGVVREWAPGGDCSGGRGCLTQPWYVGPTYWTYNEVGGFSEIYKLDPVCGWGCASPLAQWDHLGLTGVIGHPFLLGDLLIYASDQSRTGVATYDIGDPANPRLLDVLTQGGPGGYWPELWGGDGRLYVVFPYRTAGNGMRVVDITDPNDIRFVADTPLPGVESMYAQFQDEFGFMGSYKVDMRTFEPVVYFDPEAARPGQPGRSGVDTSQFLLPIGNLLVTGGIGPNEGMAIWAHQDEPDTRGPAVAYHIPKAGRTNYPVGAPISLLIHETLESPTIVNGETFIVQPVGGTPIAGQLVFAFDDILTFTPERALLADTTYEVILPAGGIKDAAGNGMEGYSFTFSTGSAVAGNYAPEVTAVAADDYPIEPGSHVVLRGTATDPDHDALEYRFDPGDGSPRTAWSTSPVATVHYARAGHFRATIQARDPAGAIGTAAVTVTVLPAPQGPRPSRSSPIACDDPNRRVWVVNPDNDSLAIIDSDARSVILERPTCRDPRSVAIDAAGEAWVACHDADTVEVHSAGGLSGSVELPYGSAPSGLAVSPDGSTAFVALQGAGELIRIDTTTRRVTGRVTLGATPRAVAVPSDGSRIYVTRLISPDDFAEIWEVDAHTLSLIRTIRIPKFGGPNHTDTTATGRGVANYLTGIAISPDGSTAWITATKPNSGRGLVTGPDLDQDNTVRNLVLLVDLAAGSLSRAIDIDNSDSASAVGFSPLGDYAFVTLQGNDQVLVVDALAAAGSDGLGATVARLGAGSAPQGVCADNSSGRMFVKNLLSRNVTVVDANSLFHHGAINPTSVAVATVADEAFSPEVLEGKRIFYDASDPRMSAEGYLSCATCHLDGGHDGRTWDFTGRGEGFRNTTTLRGRAGMGQGNVHWSGNFDEIQDFENDIRAAFGGRGFMAEADFESTRDPLGPSKAGLSIELDDLAAYVASLGAESLPRSPWRDAGGSRTAAGDAGAGLFTHLGCAACHAGQQRTDSVVGTTRLHDVGTMRTTSGARLGEPLVGIETPTLLGLWNTAPYFHDGSARSIDDVFRVAGGRSYPAEDGLVTGGAWLTDEWTSLNNDDTVYGGAFVYFGPNPSRLRFDAVDGGAGGVGAIEGRYSNGYPVGGEVVVNGTAHAVWFSPPANDSHGRHVAWNRFRVEDVVLIAGPNNVVEFVPNQEVGWSDVSLDEIVVTTADDLALAEPHRIAGGLTPAERADLVSYLLQLDGSDAPDADATPTAGVPWTSTPTPTATTVSPGTPAASPVPSSTPPATPAIACRSRPRRDCATARGARINLRVADPMRQWLDWRWQGPSTLAEFGQPTRLGPTYRLCAYLDETLVSSSVVRSGGVCGTRSCWRERPGRRISFTDRSGAQDGLTQVQVRQSRRDLRLRVRGRGPNLRLPMPIPAGANLEIQFEEAGAACWSSAFRPPGRGDGARRFRDRF